MKQIHFAYEANRGATNGQMKEQSSVMKSLQAPHHRLLQNNAKCQLFNKTALSHIVKHSVCDCESAFSPFHTFDRLGILPIYSFLQPIICLYKDKWMQCSGLISAYGKIRVSPRIERARVISHRPRKNFGKERAFGARALHG